MYISGTLLAEGTADEPIVFTELRDDAYGGDTNNDGATLPYSAAWTSIHLAAASGNTAIFSHCFFRYGGRGTNFSGAVQCKGSSPTITNCHFQLSECGLEVRNGGNPIVANNVFEQHSSTPIVVTFDGLGEFANNTFINNRYQAIGLKADTSYIAGNHTLRNINVGNIENIPYIMFKSFFIPYNVTLTIEAGILIKCAVGPANFTHYLEADGTLIAQGTAEAPIVFTDGRDDEYGGDTNTDGNMTCPEQGSGVWPGINLGGGNNQAHIFEHCILRFSVYGLSATGTTQISNCIFTYNNYGVNVSPYGGMSSIVSIDSCLFTQNNIAINYSSVNPAIISHCAFYNNYICDIRNNSSQPVNAANNWWGTAHTTSIQTVGTGANLPFIYDQADNPLRGLVTYFPPVTAPPVAYTSALSFEYDVVGNEVYFSNTSSNQDTTIYAWDFGDGSAISNQFNPNHVFTADTAGVYMVCLSTDGCIDYYSYCQQVAIGGLRGITPAQTSNNTLYIGYLQGVFSPDPTAQVYLLQGSNVIAADTTIYTSITELQINFTFADAPVGTYSIVYVSSTLTDTLLNALTIEPTTPYAFETVIEGQQNVLVNVWRNYKVAVKNLSNQTAFGVPVYIKVNGETEVDLVSLINAENLPADFDALNAHFFRVYDENAMDSVWLAAFTILNIAPNSTEYINLKVKSLTTDDFTLQTYVGQPLYSFQDIVANLQGGSTTSCGELSSCLDCLVDVSNIFPLADCTTGAMSLPCMIANDITGENSSGSKLVDWVAEVGSISTCTAPIADIAAFLKNTAKAMGDAASVTASAGGCTACFTVPQPPFVVNSLTAIDPNDKVGMVGTNALNYIQGDVPIPYTIYFENQPSATAPASEVFITDVIDTTKLDLSTLQFLGFGFGDTLRLFDQPIAATSFSRDVDLRPEINTIVRVHGVVNGNTVSWTFTSFDPETMALTEDVFAGFLPPNVTKPEGEGFVRFTIEPKPNLTTSASIQNQASIVFDANAPIVTPIFTNTIDKQKPTSSVNALPATNGTVFTVSWNGVDPHSGVAFYNVYISDNGGGFELWLANTPLTNYQFEGLLNHQYAFYSVATDNAGNVEAQTPAVEASTTVTTVSPTTATLPLKVYLEGPFNATTGKMNTNLTGNIPLSQPYNTAPWNYTGTETLSSIPSDMVDWVLVEARQPNNFSLIEQRAAILTETGTIRDMTGEAVFSSLTSGSSYYFVVRHRNHVAVMTANPVIFSPTMPTYNFTTAASQAYGDNQLKNRGTSINTPSTPAISTPMESSRCSI